MVVYVSDAGQDGGAPQLWLQQIGGAAVQLTSGLHDCAEPSFFGDDTRVAFSASGDSTSNVYEIPAGPARSRDIRLRPDTRRPRPPTQCGCAADADEHPVSVNTTLFTGLVVLHGQGRTAESRQTTSDCVAVDVARVEFEASSRP